MKECFCWSFTSVDDNLWIGYELLKSKTNDGSDAVNNEKHKL